MIPALAARARTFRVVRRRPQAAAIALLPLIAIALASLDGAVVYAAGQLLRAIGAH